MARDTPREEQSVKERGLGAGHGGDPSIGSYLSSVAHVLGLPVLVVAVFVGHLLGLYEYAMVVPVLIGTLAVYVAVLFGAMHVFTRGR